MMPARSLGSARRGVAAFLIQRITSIYLGAFTIYAVGVFLFRPAADYADWTGYFSSGAVRLAWGIFFAALLAHAWVGLRSIYMDYLKATWVRFTVSTATAFVLIALAFWAAHILTRGVV